MFRRSGYRFADKNVRQSMILEHVPIPKERTCSSVLCRKSRTYSDGAGGRQGKLPLPAKRGEVNNHTFDAFAVDEARRARMTRPEGPTDVPSCWPAVRQASMTARRSVLRDVSFGRASPHRRRMRRMCDCSPLPASRGEGVCLEREFALTASGAVTIRPRLPAKDTRACPFLRNRDML